MSHPQQVGLVDQEQEMSQRPWRADQLCCAMLRMCVEVACDQPESIVWHTVGSRVYMHNISYKQNQGLKVKETAPSCVLLSSTLPVQSRGGGDLVRIAHNKKHRGSCRGNRDLCCHISRQNTASLAKFTVCIFS